jgi:hypothetical protein
MAFGSIPYKRSNYNIVEKKCDEEMLSLIQCLMNFKEGKFNAIDELILFLSNNSMDIRNYACQLFSDVCSYKNVHHFNNAWELVETHKDIRSLILKLGDTLCLTAIPILLSWREDLEDVGFDGYICQSLANIYPLQGVDEYNIDDIDINELYNNTIEKLDKSTYYFKGMPVFLGNISKDLIIKCQVSHKEKKQAFLVSEPQILSNFSGIVCPISLNESVDEKCLTSIYNYVNQIAGMPWKKGSKYFFSHEVI